MEALVTAHVTQINQCESRPRVKMCAEERHFMSMSAIRNFKSGRASDRESCLQALPAGVHHYTGADWLGD
jgi:hypothetical protein